MIGLLIFSPTSHATDTVTHFAVPSGYYYGESGTYTYYDYCPLCGAHDCLSWNPKCAKPGEWSCLECGADFDGTNGYDKYGGGARGQLIKYYEPTPEPVIQENQTTQPAPTALEIAQTVYKSNKIFSLNS